MLGYELLPCSEAINWN